METLMSKGNELSINEYETLVKIYYQEDIWESFNEQ